MTINAFVPLKIDLIDEGRFMVQAQEERRQLMAGFVAYDKKWGDRAVKSKASLTITITMVNAGEGIFALAAEIKTSQPNQPVSVTRAIGADDDDGKPSLFVQRAGSSQADPRQRRITTQDGRTVDAETGEVVD